MPPGPRGYQSGHQHPLGLSCQCARREHAAPPPSESFLTAGQQLLPFQRRAKSNDYDPKTQHDESVSTTAGNAQQPSCKGIVAPSFLW